MEIREIDGHCDHFENLWKQAPGPSVEEFIQNNALDPQERLLRELILLEIEYRCRHGLVVDKAQYQNRFNVAPFEIEGLIDSVSFADPAQSTTDQEKKSSGSNGQRDDDFPPAIGKYQILAEIGRGGQSIVYRAFDRNLEQQVALKIAKTSVADEVSTERMKTEGRILAKLTHPALANVREFDVFEGRPYLAIELVDGPNLRQDVGNVGVEWKRATRLMARIASAVDFLHTNGVIHRDLKPANIILRESNNPVIVDFGLAVNQTGWTKDDLVTSGIEGTIAFMAPEQASPGQEITRHTDIFGLGATLFYLLTGRPPISGDSPSDVLEKASRGEIDLTALQQTPAPAALKRICTRALSKNKSDRFAGAGDMVRELQTLDRRATIKRLAPAAAAILIVVAAAISFLVFARPFLGEPGPLIGEYLVECEPLIGRFVGYGYQAFENSEPPRVKGRLRLSVKLQQPAWCYLLAYNPPDGTLDHDFEGNGKPQRWESEFRFPALGQDTYPLRTAGRQVFVLVVSAKPLPELSKWKYRSEIPSHWDMSGDSKLWYFDGNMIEPGSFRASRGPTERDASGDRFELLVQSIQTRIPDVEIFAVAFPVRRINED